MTATTTSPDKPVILAAGGILYRHAPAGDEILVVHRKRYGDWTLPKGKLKAGETLLDTALREVHEETGCITQIEEYLGAIGYEVNGAPKVVLFWRMSLVEQKEITDHEEVAEVRWMSVAAAVQQLSHADERALALRAAGEPRGYHAPEPLKIKLRRRWFRPQERDYGRLLREFESFRIELALLEAQSKEKDKSWAPAARDQLRKVVGYLENRMDVEGGWLCLHAARRHAVWGLNPAELAMQAAILREETTKFSSSWRSKAMLNLLDVKDHPITVSHLTSAMALRDEYFSNQYHKVWLMGDQLALLLMTGGIGLLLLAPLVFFNSRHPEGSLPPWGYQMATAVLSFGLLGAAFSTVLSLINATAETKIPERVANQFVTSSRALFGAVAGLAGYAFYQSKVLDIKIGGDTGPGGALTVAFLFGFAGERLIARVLGSLGANKS